MSVAREIGAAWIAPRRTARRLLAQGQREDRAFAALMGACVLILLSEVPALARSAALDPAIPFEARLAGAALAWLAIMPLALYGLAALSHLVARAFGGRGSYYGARLALFRALLAATPAWLAQAAAGAVAPGWPGTAAGAMALGLFLWLWLPALAEAERRETDAAG